jgi:hypothetical protein
VDSRTYVGQPNERVTLTTQLSGGGQASVVVNGQDIGAARQFSLPPNPGDRVKFQVSLLGPLGASCVVGISTVDGGSDGDFLMCQAHNPAPVNFYTCSVVGATALRALAQARGLQPSPATSARARKAPKKSGKVSASKKRAGK